MDRMTGVMTVTGECLARAMAEIGVPTDAAQSWHEDWLQWVWDVESKIVGLVEGSGRLANLLEQSQRMSVAANLAKHGS